MYNIATNRMILTKFCLNLISDFILRRPTESHCMVLHQVYVLVQNLLCWGHSKRYIRRAKTLISLETSRVHNGCCLCCGKLIDCSCKNFTIKFNCRFYQFKPSAPFYSFCHSYVARKGEGGDICGGKSNSIWLTSQTYKCWYILEYEMNKVTLMLRWASHCSYPGPVYIGWPSVHWKASS